MNIVTKLILGCVAGLFGTGLLFFAPLPIPGDVGPLLAYIFSIMLFMASTMYLAVNMRQAFWKIAKSNDVVLTQRRDGFLEMAEAEYYTGWLKTKFGYHLMTDKNKEITTKKNISIALDMYGPTINPEHVQAVEQFAKDNKIKSATELDSLLDKWHVCTKCKWEGIPDNKTEEKETEVGGIKQVEQIVVGKICGNGKCKAEGDLLEHKAPSVLTPFYKTVSLEPVRLLMKHGMNPSKAAVLTDRLARIKMGMNTKMTEFILRMFGIGIAGLFLLIGMGVFLKIAGVL